MQATCFLAPNINVFCLCVVNLYLFERGVWKPGGGGGGGGGQAGQIHVHCFFGFVIFGVWDLPVPDYTRVSCSCCKCVSVLFHILQYEAYLMC